MIPIALFAYARPDHLRRTLDALRANQIPHLYVFCDGAKGDGDAGRVAAVREMVHGIDWCEKTIIERDRNLGLGVSIRAGVDEVLKAHNSLIVFEDDIVCVPGTYAYLCAALRHYETDLRVMSIAAWAHPLLRPPIPKGEPFFDGRFACWGWGTWRRAWQGMDVPAAKLLSQCRWRLRNPSRYGEDIPAMARQEAEKNIWAVRFALLHILGRGLCLHPPQALVEHIGFDDLATDAKAAGWLAQPMTLAEAPVVPSEWPEPVEHAESPQLNRRQYGETDTAWLRARWLLTGMLHNARHPLNAARKLVLHRLPRKPR